MKRSKDINIYEIRLEGLPTWNIDISSFISDNALSNLLTYDYVRLTLPNYGIRKLISFNQFYNFIGSSIGACISVDDCFTEDGLNTVNGYLEITAISGNIATLTYREN